MDGHPFDPDWTLAPAALLREVMSERGWTELTLAAKCATAPGSRWNTPAALARVRAVLDRQPFTEEIAVMIAAGTGTAVSFWLNAERIYREALAAGKTDVT